MKNKTSRITPANDGELHRIAEEVAMGLEPVRGAALILINAPYYAAELPKPVGMRTGVDQMDRIFAYPIAASRPAFRSPFASLIIRQHGEIRTRTMRKSFVCAMPTWLQILAISVVLTPAINSGSLAQYACPAGYTFYGGTCQPSGYAPGNPVSGAVGGTAAGAAAGSATAGPVGGLVGGALGAATGTVAGTANAVTGTVNTVTGVPANPSYGSGYPPAPAPACGPGTMLYNGVCYPAAR